MMKIPLIAMVAATVGLTMLEGPAQADSINFLSLSTGQSVTNQYPDVTFSLSGGLASGDPTIAYYGGLSNSPDSGNYPTADSLIANFAMPVSGVSFTFDTEGFDGNNNFRVYDGPTLLWSGTLDGYRVPYDISSLSGITEIIWSNGEGTSRSWTQALDTLNYTPAADAVPEPATLALFVAGLTLLGWRMKKAQASA